MFWCLRDTVPATWPRSLLKSAEHAFLFDGKLRVKRSESADLPRSAPAIRVNQGVELWVVRQPLARGNERMRLT